MIKLPAQVEAFVLPFIKSQSKAQFRKRLERAAPAILKRMAKDNPEKKGARHEVRYCLYWLCKSVVKSGEIADLWRDHIDDGIVADVPSPLLEDHAAVLAAVTNALVERVF